MSGKLQNEKKSKDFDPKTQQRVLKTCMRELKLKSLDAYALNSKDRDNEEGENIRDLVAQEALIDSKIYLHSFIKDAGKNAGIEMYDSMINRRRLKSEREACSIMLSYLSIEQQQSVETIEDPYVLWQRLENFFFKRGDLAARAAAEKDLLKALKDLKLARRDIDSYLTRVSEAYGGVKSANTEQDARAYTEERLIFQLLDALEGEKAYDSTVTQLKVVQEMEDPESPTKKNTWVRVRVKLLAAETKMKNREEATEEATTDEASDFEEKTTNVTKKMVADAMKVLSTIAPGGARDYRKKYTGICEHCKKVGHSVERCWEKFPEKMPEHVRKRRARQ
jgi:hypothetical protein